MDTTIAASHRPDLGKGSARKIRREGKLPAIVYSQGNEPTHIAVDPEALVDLFRTTRNRNTIVQLKIDDGDAKPCLVREVQRHPIRRDILHVDFYAVEKEQPVDVMVPVTTTGKAAGAVMGGRIRVVRRELPVRAPYDSIPEILTVDVSPLDIGDIVKASEISVPEGVELRVDKDINVVSCYGRRVSTKAEKK